MVNAIETKGLTKRFGDRVAVRDLDLAVERGVIYGFLGLNGAGKTTTVRMLTGALPPSSGRASVMGMDVARDAKAAAARVGVVYGENLAPEPGMSPVQYVRHFARLHGMPRDEAHARMRTLFDVLRLQDGCEAPIHRLSGGNRRKVELARALVHEPDVLLLDEPTRELDIPAKRAVWAFLKRLVSERGLTVFLSSHDAAEIATLCARIGVLHGGRLAWEGTAAELTSGGQPLVHALGGLLEGDAACPD